MKPKELVEERDEIVRLITLCNDGNVNITEEKYSKVKNYLTQQRTELLKTIDTELEVDLKGKTNEPDSEYDEGWNNACLEWDLLLNKTIDRIKRGVFDKNINLLNKKDETK